MVGEDGGALLCGYGTFEDAGEVLAVKDIVAKYQSDIVVADKVFANNKGLGQSVGRWLFGIAECYAKLTAVAEHALESRQVDGG